MKKYLFFAALALGCNNGEPNGELRITGGVTFAETEDLNAPFAVGRIVPVFLSDEGSGDPLSQLTLTIEPQDSAQVIALGSATFGVVLETAGEYTLSVSDGDSVIETLDLSAQEITGLRLSTEASFTTTKNQGSEDECSKTKTKSRFNPEKFTLHQNQSLDISVIPVGANGEPLLGLLALTIDSEAPIAFDAANLAPANLANSFTILPQGDLGAAANITFSEDALTLSLSLETSADDDFVLCF